METLKVKLKCLFVSRKCWGLERKDTRGAMMYESIKKKGGGLGLLLKGVCVCINATKSRVSREET